MAGKAEKVAAVVQELVHGGAGDQRGRALFRAHEIKGNQQQEAAEQRPGQDLADRNGQRADVGGRSPMPTSAER